MVRSKIMGYVFVLVLASTVPKVDGLCSKPKTQQQGPWTERSPKCFTISAFSVLISNKIQSYLSTGLLWELILISKLKKNGENQVFRETWTLWFLQSPFQILMQESFRTSRTYFRCFNPFLSYHDEAIESRILKWNKSQTNSKRGLPAAPGLA